MIQSSILGGLWRREMARFRVAARGVNHLERNPETLYIYEVTLGRFGAHLLQRHGPWRHRRAWWRHRLGLGAPRGPAWANVVACPLKPPKAFLSASDQIRSDPAYLICLPSSRIQSVSCLIPVKCVTAVGSTYVLTRYENSFSIDGLHWYLAGCPSPRHTLIGRS